MYKPHTIEQYKVYRFLEENFALEHFLLAGWTIPTRLPTSRRLVCPIFFTAIFCLIL